MPNIEYFDISDYSEKHQAKLRGINFRYKHTLNEFNKAYERVDQVGLGAPEVALSIASGIGSGALAGAALPIFGPAIGAGIGGFLGAIGVLFKGFKSEALDRKQQAAVGAIKTRFQRASEATKQALNFSQQRFQNIQLFNKASARFLKNKNAAAHLELNATMLAETNTFKRNLANLGLKLKTIRLERGNVARTILRQRDLFKVKQEAIIAKYNITKESIDNKLNILGSKYRMASLAKDMRALDVVKAKQAQFLSTITPVTKGAAESLRPANRTLKQVSDSLALMNSIEQTQAQIVLGYRELVQGLNLQAKELSGAARLAKLSYKINFKELTNTAANTLDRLNTQLIAYGAELQNLAQQRRILNETFTNRQNFYSARRLLLNEELGIALDRLNITTTSQLTAEAENYTKILDHYNNLSDQSASRITDIVSSDEIGEISGLSSSFNNALSVLQNYLNTQARSNVQAPQNSPSLQGPKIQSFPIQPIELPGIYNV